MEEGQLPTRWEIELEFVQSLANIQYLNHLAQNNYLQDDTFLNYLQYLNYWRQPEYAKYLVYPNCLHILSLLQSEDFRRNIISPEFMNRVMNDMVQRWQQTELTIEDKQESSEIVNGPLPEIGEHEHENENENDDTEENEKPIEMSI